MKFRVLSDLHLEFKDYTVPRLPDDAETALILAGDIGVDSMAVDFIDEHIDQFKHIIYVPGNHEFYHSAYEDVLSWWNQVDIPGFHFLHNKSVIIDGVAIHGSTLWTDFDKENPLKMFHARQRINDFRYITFNGRVLTPEDTVEFHKEAVSFLAQAMAKSDYPDIVVTHHAPTAQSINPIFAGDMLNAAYANNLDHLIIGKKPVYWLHGHTHHAVVYDVDKTTVVANPRGYAGYEKTNWNERCVFEV